MSTESGFPSPPPGCPAHGRVPLHGAEFQADPDSYYAWMRNFGPTAPVELAPGVEATLVTDYTAALQLLQDPDTFRKDSRRWRAFNEGKISPNSPVVPLLAYRPNCMFTDGADHLRLRQAVTDTMARVDSHQLKRNVDRISRYLIEQFNSRGSVDLLNDYAKLLPLFVFSELFGCPADIGDRVIFGINGIFDGINAEKANAVLAQSVAELVALRRSKPGDDVTSWLMQHPAQLNDEEMAHQLVLLLGAGAEPLRNLIGNGLCLILSDDRYSGGGLLVEDAIDEVLWNNPPMSNYAPHYPVADTEFAGRHLNAGELVLVSFAAANTDPALSGSRQLLSKRAHLAWSTGPHGCPAKDPAQLITVAAIENLLNELPDIELAVPVDSLTWRPGPFNRALAALPARFEPIRQAPNPATAAQKGQAGTSGTQGRPQGKAEKGGLWSSFLAWWKV
ncbi:Cytochrome P450 [Actinacidiphila yanglinensis]|uniref:Cytochrome P450 n=1 Tax=Actinacidiphila yanglinensis TaxID=310779 RepID=A0A1H6DSQ8_9ACTN|nr:cytochrome P450 [Actinacidiphila yanglinensis]SEG88422.1 Cytochrome P450 [Actinacidiphila yanglinensis]